MTLPEGYDTVIGERGAGLSGGQRQRVAPGGRAVERGSHARLLRKSGLYRRLWELQEGQLARATDGAV